MTAQNDPADTSPTEIQAMRRDPGADSPELQGSAIPGQTEMPEFPGDGAGAGTDAASASQKPRARRPHRRVTTQAVPGTDPTPAPEPSRSSGTENDARLKADKPPHWG